MTAVSETLSSADDSREERMAVVPTPAAAPAPSRPPLVPGSVADHTICLLLKLGQVAYRVSEDRMAALGLRVRHYSVLQALVDNGPMSQLELGTHLRIDAATMVSTLDHLEQTGLATRARDPRDRRRYLVQVTDAGRETTARANDGLDGLDGTTLRELPPEDRAALHRILTTLAAGEVLPEAFDAVRGS